MFNRGEISQVLANLPTEKRPIGDCASCMACIWLTAGSTEANLYGHCTAMGKIIFSETESPPTVLKCSAYCP